MIRTVPSNKASIHDNHKISAIDFGLYIRYEFPCIQLSTERMLRQGDVPYPHARDATVMNCDLAAVCTAIYDLATASQDYLRSSRR